MSSETASAVRSQRTGPCSRDHLSGLLTPDLYKKLRRWQRELSPSDHREYKRADEKWRCHLKTVITDEDSMLIPQWGCTGKS